MTNEQKAAMLECIALGCLEGVAALLREAAGMMRERGKVQWDDAEGSESCLAVYGGYLLRVDRASVPTYWTVYDGDVLFVYRWRAADVEAAQAAAVAWVDEQEGKP